jgi:hypothetical protein
LPQTSADVRHASARRDVACNVSAHFRGTGISK